MKFYRSAADGGFETPEGAELPCILYWHGNWDDYRYKTLHHLCLVLKTGQKVPMGDVKILQEDSHDTSLPQVFTELGSDFVSLGQELNYYELMRTHLPRSHQRVLQSLNDLVVKPQLQEKVETTSGFRNSLIRFNEAKICLRDGQFVLQNSKPRASYKFRYGGRIPNSDGPTYVDVDLHPDDPVPGRIVAIIGRNGVGKTQYLAQLARDLANTQRVSKDTEDQILKAFEPSRPLFTRVLALSFSAFDKFVRPEPREFFSYIYCGVRDDGGALSRKALDVRHLQYLHRIRDQERQRDWEDHVTRVTGLPKDQVSFRQSLAELEGRGKGEESSMSSGQSILVYFVSAALAYLKDQSLILFDEPEIHLHPNAVAQLMQTLQILLEDYSSYAIIATHSPVVIQEVPSKRVIRFDREENVTTAHRLERESFGENIAELTRQVFETVEIPNFYKQTLRTLAERMPFEQVSRLFDDKLSLHATAYLASLYDDDNEAADA